MMKRFLGFFLVAVMLLSMAALPAMAEVTELQFWTWRPEDTDFYDKIIKQFEEANPDVKVVQNPVKNTEYNTILSAALAGDSGPDVFMARAYGGLQTFSDSGYMLALDELMPELANFSQATRMGAMSITDGKMYGLPAVSQTVFCFYNKNIYKELGLEVPKTWDEFIANLEAVKAGGYEAMANGTKDGWACETLFGGVCPSIYGGTDFYNKLYAGETTFEDPVFVDAIDHMLALAPYLPDLYEGVSYEDMRSRFINELSGHIIGGSYEAAYFDAQNPELDYDIFAVPGKTENDPATVSVYADMNFAVSAATKKQEAALKFLHFLSTVEFGNQVVTDLGMVSSVPGVDVSANPFIGRVLELQKNSTPYLFLVGFRYSQPTGSSIIQSAGQGLMTKTLTPQEVCQQLQEGIATYFVPFQK